MYLYRQILVRIDNKKKASVADLSMHFIEVVHWMSTTAAASSKVLYLLCNTTEITDHTSTAKKVISVNNIKRWKETVLK